DIQTNV
ncbi:unnamed protein product, partial [Callosobruchus maculatus]